MISTRQKQGFYLVLILLFLLMMVLNALTPWIADDYHYAYSFATDERLTSVWDIFPSLKEHAHIMNGRYTPHFLVQLFTLLPWRLFDVCNSLVFVLLIWGMHRLVCGPKKYDVLMLCGLTAAVFVLVPGFGPSFLWMAGACNYLWCDVLLVWLLVPFADAVLERKGEPSCLMRAVMIPAALFFGNMSQNVSAGGVMLMVLAMLWLIWKKNPVRWWMILTALAAFGGWLLCLSAPADIGRIQYGTPSLGQIMDNFQLAANMMIQYGTIPSIALLILTVFSWYEKPDTNRLAMILGLFAAAIACNYAMAVSVYYPDRAFTGTALMLVCGCAIALPKGNHPKWKACLTLCLAFFMCTTLLHALPDMYDCYAMYNDREKQAAQAADNGENDFVTFGIESRSRYDGFYQLHDLTIYPDATANRYFARYHGLNAVTIERME